MPCLLNKAAVRRLILDRAKILRPAWPCTRVSGQALAQIEALLRTRIDDEIRRHPTLGKTFTMPA